MQSHECALTHFASGGCHHVSSVSFSFFGRVDLRAVQPDWRPLAARLPAPVCRDSRHSPQPAGPSLPRYFAPIVAWSTRFAHAPSLAGLEISKGYIKGEWRAKFTNTSVTISSPSGKVVKAQVSTVGQYMVLNGGDIGKVSTLWQVAGGVVTEFLSVR